MSDANVAPAQPWYLPSTPEAGILALPWLHPYVVEHLAGLLRSDWKVLEHGAGGSTLWLAVRCAQVVTVEHDRAWAESVRKLAPDNVKVLALLPAGGGFDLMFVDGERAERGYCLAHAHEFVRSGGWVVLDNANRPEYAAERQILSRRARLSARFDNNIPGSKYFITEFWQLCGPG